MKKLLMDCSRKLVSAAFAASAALGCLPAAAQENLREIGAAIAPPELMATYSCTTYAAAVFLPKAIEAAKLQKSGDKAAALKRMLSEYDGLVEGMCRETSVVFERQRDRVLDVYARQLPGAKDNIKTLLANPMANRWLSENATFLKTAAPLVQYYALVQAVAPELLDAPQANLDEATISEVNKTSVGMSAEFERKVLIVLLGDGKFASLAPKRFDVPTLKRDELRLRKEAARLIYATTFGWFNDNASDLVRMHFNGFDVMREIGLAEIYMKYHPQMEKMLRTTVPAERTRLQ